MNALLNSCQHLSRRKFLRNSGLLAAAGSLLPALGKAAEAQAATGQIAEVALDLNRIKKWDDSNGDTWDPFWADDDALYAFNCDGRGFGTKQANLAFNRFSGTSFDGLVGSQVNPMSEYGAADERGPDHATWKACVQECIDGVFYAFVARNVYGHESHDPLTRQTSLNASLIKSHDRGLTWTRSAQENYARPMWPGASFGAPFFVHYGRDGRQVEEDGAREFVYAVSTNGFWNDGDYLVLGRVPRRGIEHLDPAHWQYFRGGNGLDSASWTSSVFEASPILTRPARCGQTPITWVPSLGLYLLISWYNPEPLPSWFKPKEMRYDFHAAPHPWGPWSQVGSASDSFLAPGHNMYGPSICAKYQAARPGETEVTMFTSGCQFEDVPSGIYKAWSIPVLLRTGQVPAGSTLAWESAQIARHGDWKVFPASTGRDNQALRSEAAGDRLQIALEGTGVECVARKASGYGDFDIRIDDQPAAMVSLATRNLPELSGVSIFRKTGLAAGKHTLSLRNAGSGPVNLQRITIYR